MVLGVDPGYKQSAFVIYEPKAQIILNHAIVDNEILLNNIKDGSLGAVDLLAIEFPEGFGMTAGQELFHTCRWAGLFEGAFRGKVQLCGRKAIKVHLCGHTSAKDKDTREALIHRFGEPGTKKNPGKLYGIASHGWAALATAIFASESEKHEK